MKASANGYTECVILLLEAGAEMNATCKDDCTSLIYSSMFGHEACLDALIAAGANVNATCKERHTAMIHWVSGHGREHEQSTGCTALTIASNNGHDKCVNKLIEAGADVNRMDDEGFTALIAASYYGNYKCVKQLLQSGADVNIKTKRSKTTALLMASVYLGQLCRAMSSMNNISYVAEDHNILKCIEALISAGAGVNTMDADGNVPLFGVVSHGHQECVPVLLAAGADVNTIDRQCGDSALIAAIRMCSNATCNQLLEAGADVNVVDNFGSTALVTAALEGNVYMVKHLLKTNCRINKMAGMTQNALTCHLKHMWPKHIDYDRPHPRYRRPKNKDISRLLFAAGEMLDDGDGDDDIDDLADLELKDIKMQLKHISRQAIRKHLLELYPHSNLFGSIPLLGLPHMINQYLVYGQSLDDDSDNKDDNNDDDKS